MATSSWERRNTESGRDRQWAAWGSRRELCGTRRPALTSHGLFPLRTSREQEQHLCPARAVLAVCPGTDRAPVGSTCRHCRARATPATGIFWKREFPWDPGSLTTPLAAGPWKSNGGWGWCPRPDIQKSTSVSDGQELGATRWTVLILVP